MSSQMSEYSFASLLVKCTLIDIMFKYYNKMATAAHSGKPAEQIFYIYKCQMSKARTMLNINSGIKLWDSDTEQVDCFQYKILPKIRKITNKSIPVPHQVRATSVRVSLHELKTHKVLLDVFH